MKFLKAMMISLMALMVFTGCEKFTCNDSHAMSELAGTWTCVQPGLAEALVIKANGSVVSTGVENGEYWENVKGNIAINEGKISMTFEDGDNFEGHFDFIPGLAFSVCSDKGERYLYNYCKEELSDEIVGMWVCNDATNGTTTQMAINTYTKDGTCIFTGIVPNTDSHMVNVSTNYKVIGDIMFTQRADNQLVAGDVKFVASRLMYTPNATLHGDVMSYKHYITTKNETSEIVLSYLRINQNLDLASKKYDHIKTFVTNVKGVDKDIDIMGIKFNFAKMDGVKLNKMLKTLLFAVEFPNANTIRYNYFYNGKNNSLEAPIVVDGNKMTVKMSQKNPLFKDIDLYTFQDSDATQMHMYMPTYAFINFFGNMQATIMAQNGLLDLTDATAVNSIFDSIDNAVETINLSLVMEKAN